LELNNLADPKNNIVPEIKLTELFMGDALAADHESFYPVQM
jgi:hypothetical protein